jgi:hypothetical protein
MNINHSTHKILRNLGNVKENPNVGKPKEREREILLASRNIYQQQQYIYNQEK